MKNLKESEVGTSEISYFELASKLKAAYRAKAKNQDDMYAEVSVRCYCGGPFEMNITCSGLDDMPNEVAFYVTYLAEDDFSFDVGFGMNNLKTTISDYYKDNGDLAEMSPKIAIAPSALRFLDEIAAGQGMLFEKKVNEGLEDDDPINEDIGTVEVTFNYGDGDKDYDTGYIVQYADRYEVQSDLNRASGKTIEEMKANFEKEVESNLDYDVEDLFFDWNIEEGLEESKKKVNEAVVDYIHPRLKIEAEYVPTVYYACYTLDNEGNEVDHFDNFNYFEDAVSACRQKTDDTHQATHACVVIEDEQDDEALEFKRSYRLSSNYEVVAEFSPDAGDILTEGRMEDPLRF